MIQDSREDPNLYIWKPAVRQVETVDDANWKEFTSSPRAVLVLTQSNCPACRGWLMELKSFLANRNDYENVRFGEIVIDADDTVGFRRENDWLDQVEFTPFNAVYVDGQPSGSFFGADVDRMIDLLRRLGIEGDPS